MAFADFETEDRRLVILRLLSEDADYCTNSSVLERGLDVWGLSVSRARLHTDLTWLSEQGLLSVEHVGSVMVAKLNQHGLDVANGRASVPGIKRPGPQ